MPYSIAIDGPSGAGKSTIARRVAEALGFCYLDTGAMYRTCGYCAQAAGADPEDADTVGRLLRESLIDVRFEDGEQHMWLNDEDVSPWIRTSEIGRLASDVSKIPEVRRLMAEAQRRIAARENIVMDGRDIGTYVLPDADLKIFLTATPDERAVRRYRELHAKDADAPSLEEVRDAMAYRDRQDESRALAPLKRADDAVEVDTTGMSIDEVTRYVLDLAKGRFHA